MTYSVTFNLHHHNTCRLKDYFNDHERFNAKYYAIQGVDIGNAQEIYKELLEHEIDANIVEEITL